LASSQPRDGPACAFDSPASPAFDGVWLELRWFHDFASHGAALYYARLTAPPGNIFLNLLFAAARLLTGTS
jgi:hypothetical protein